MKKHSIISLLLLVVPMMMSAQSFNSGYFLDGYNYGNTINPAFQPDKDTRSYVGFLINNLGVNAYGNVGASSFLYPIDGQLVTGLNRQVPAATFLENLNDLNLVGATYNENLLNMGFSTASGKGFVTFDLGLKGLVGAEVPGSLFEMFKVGVEGAKEYSINDVDVNTSHYAECALGFSQQIGKRLKVGARAKFLVGLAYADVNLNTLEVKRGADDEFYSTGIGSVSVASPLVGIKVEDGKYDFQSINFNSVGLGGFGLAFDLGATFSPIDDLTLDFALQDIGSINWKRNINGVMDCNNVPFSNGGDINYEEMFVYKAQDADVLSVSLPMTVRMGAKYNLPFYEKLSARVLGTFVNGGTNYKEVRFGATVTPVKQISATVNYGITSCGGAMGAAVNFNLGFISLFLGADSVINTVTPQYIPVNPFSIAVAGGITIQTTRKH